MKSQETAEIKNNKSKFGIVQAYTFLMPELFRQRRKFIVLLFLAIISALCCYLLPQTQKYFIDKLSNSAPKEALVALILSGVIFIATSGVDIFAAFLLRRTNAVINVALRNRMFRLALSLPLEKMEQFGEGYLSERLQNDIRFASFLYGNALWNCAKNTLSMIAVVIAIALLDWRILPFLAVILPIYALLVRKFTGRQIKIATDRCEQEANVGKSLYDTLRNFRLVKSTGAETERNAKFRGTLRLTRDLQYRQIAQEMWFGIILSALPAACYFVLFICGIFLVNDKIWTLGFLWALFSYTRNLFAPLRLLSGSVVAIGASLAAAERLHALKKLHGTNEGGLKVEKLRGEFELKDLDYAYQGGEPIYGKLNLKIAAGEHIALTGPSGRGKSTLLELLMNLRMPTQGEILVDGVPLNEFNPAYYRRRIGYLGQNSELFAGTVLENLVYALDKTPSDEEIANVLDKVGLRERLPNNGKEIIAEGATNFSSGEKMRLIVAREFLRDTDVILLDEPVAHLDVTTAEEILTLIDHIFAGKTIIVATHAESVSKRMDRAINLDLIGGN